MDDTTVEAIWEEGVMAKVDYLTIEAVERWLPIFAKHLPDPRPTEAEVSAAIETAGGGGTQGGTWRTVLRELGCFRPEPAACYHGPECSGAGPDCGPAEPVPVVEPPTDSAFTRCPFCSYILPPGSIIGGKPEPLAVPTTEDPRG